MATAAPSAGWQQIAHYVRSAIKSGELRPGEPLLSVRNLAKTIKRAPGTVQAAYKELEREGLIYAVPFEGYYVADSQALITASVRETLSRKIADFWASLLSEGFTEKDIRAAFAARAKEKASL